MTKYLAKTQNKLRKFKYEIGKIVRTENLKAETLAKYASSHQPKIPKGAFIEVLKQSSIADGVEIMMNEVMEDWGEPSMSFLKGNEDIIPEDNLGVIRAKAKRYAIVNNELYWRSFSGPWLKCIRPEEGKMLLSEIHEGVCGSHIKAYAITTKAMRQGVY
jgi:hypothetical protein